MFSSNMSPFLFDNGQASYFKYLGKLLGSLLETARAVLTPESLQSKILAVSVPNQSNSNSDFIQ